MNSKDPIARHHCAASVSLPVNGRHPEIADPTEETCPVRLDDCSPVMTAPYLDFLRRPAAESAQPVTCVCVRCRSRLSTDG